MGVKTEKPAELLQGTLDLLILKALTRGKMHGYEEGALYPALHRLELRGLLASEWGASENNRRAKYCILTRAGRKRLATATESWRRTSTAVDRILETA
jgi:DNA-binding PadR family transcriptional regulator